MSYSAELAGRCMKPVDDAARQKAALHVLDWLGCAAIGAASPMATALWQGFGLPGASMPPDGAVGAPAQDPWQSLLFEAAIGNILEMDDIHRTALVHPGPVVIPAALSMARRLQRSGNDFLDAVVRGYEAMIRLGSAVGPGHYSHWHNTSTCGPLGAAAAGASLLGLSSAEWRDAFGHAATQASGLWQVRLDPCMSKQWHIARAAQTGVQAAMLAASGATGPQHIFEGEKGFFAAMCPDGDMNRMLADMDGHWQIYATSLKPWPACRHAHPAIDAALSLREQIQRDCPGPLTSPDRVEAIYVRTYADALAFCDKPDPLNPEQARFSLQHSVALALLKGPPALADFELESINKPQHSHLRHKVSLEHSWPWNANYPHHFGAELSVKLIDGQSWTASVIDTLGDPERPLSVEAITEKARDLMRAAGWTNATIQERIRQCRALPGMSSILQSFPALSPQLSCPEDEPHRPSSRALP